MERIAACLALALLAAAPGRAQEVEPPPYADPLAIGEADLRRIDAFLNDRPRKCLGWKTPREVMDAFLAAAA